MSLNLVNTSMAAITNQIDENSSLEEVQQVLEQYSIVSENGMTFDMEKAVEDGQSEFVLETGKVINQLDQDTESSYDALGIPIPIWGNWCGPTIPFFFITIRF